MTRQRVMLDDGWRLDMHVEAIEVTTALPQADPNWMYRDAAGHDHRAVTPPRDSKIRWISYPTLKWVSRMVWCPDCMDEHDQGHYECPDCGEHIVPGVRPGAFSRDVIPGMTDLVLTSPEGDRWPLTMEEYTEIALGGQEALNAVVARHGWTRTRTYGVG